MGQIKQLLLLHSQKKGAKTIARLLGMSKTTVKAYIAKFENLTSGQDGKSLQYLMSLENPELEAKFHPGNPAYKDDRYEEFKDQLPYLLAELEKVGVTRRLLWEEYRAQQPAGYRYTQFCYHLQQHRKASRPSMVLQHKPGDKLYIDFSGKKLHYIDRDSGEVVPCYVFVACLPYSDYGFAIAVRSQTTEDFLFALFCCLLFLGGVPMALVPDNMKAAVTKANRYEPTISQALEDFANHHGTTVVPARAAKPQDKALVENQVKLLYTRVYARLRHQRFFDLESLNEAIAQKVKAHNQTRMQQKPYCREERFLANEKQYLLPLPAERFQLKYYHQLTVGKNNHIYLSRDKHYYSVPYQFIGQKVKVIYTRTLVCVYHNGRQVAAHSRQQGEGIYTTTKDHLCSQHQQYLDRSPDYYLQRARQCCTALHELVSKIFQQNRYPEQAYRTCDGLLRLFKTYDTDLFERACQMALDHQMYSYGSVKKILENRMAEFLQEPPVEKALPVHNNLRGKEYYQQLTLKL